MAAKKRSAAKASKRTTGARAAAAAPKRKAKAAPRGAAKALTAKAGTSKGATATKTASTSKAATTKAAALAKAPVGKKASSKAAPPKEAAPKRAAAPRSPAAASPAGAAPSAGIAEGDRAPAFSLSDQTGAPVSSDDLAGKPYVLYFYPKDDTPGCTTEACGFRDAISDFDGIGVRVVGVSPDSVATHQKFVGKYGLPFTLLSDSARDLASAYGVWALKKLYGRESMGIVRSTFLVDGDGVVRKAWRNVRVAGHVPEVQAAAARLG